MRQPIDQGGTPPTDLTFIQILDVAWQGRREIVLMTICAAILSIVGALVATPYFRAQVVVSIVKDDGMAKAGALGSQLGGLASLAGINLGGLGGGSSVGPAVLQSRHLVERFIAQERVIEMLEPGSGEETSLWKAVLTFRRNHLFIQDDPRTGLITVAVEWTDPQVAARWANSFVALADEMVRTRAKEQAESNIGFLNEQLSRTEVVELQRVIYNLIETETKTLMLANARREFAFEVIDPAVPPELRERPSRTLIVILGTLLGGALGVLLVFGRRALRDLR